VFSSVLGEIGSVPPVAELTTPSVEMQAP
jgi:hypothetical protein